MESPFASAPATLPFKPRDPALETAPLEPDDDDDDEAAGGTVVGTIPHLNQRAELPFRGAQPAPARESGAYPALGGLPFRAGAAASPSPPAQAGGLPFRPAAPLPPPKAPPPPARDSSPAARDSSPPERSSAPPAPPREAPRLTIEQFASLAAEIAVSPGHAHEIRGRYGFDEAGHRREAEQWNRRFSADGALYQRYTGLFQTYRDWLAKNPR